MSLNLNDKEWHPFKIGELFKTSKGIYLNKKNILNGQSPYITASSANNGVTNFIGNPTLFSKNSITIEKVKLSSFYQPTAYYCSHDVSSITHENLNKFSALFISSMINRQGVKYSYGRQAQLNVVKRETVFLPVTKNGKLDWQYMVQFAKSILENKKTKYVQYCREEFKKLEYKKIALLDEKKWDEFFIQDIAKVKPGKRLTKADMIAGNKPFIGSTDSNNGITEFVSNTNSSEDSNVLGVNYNGSVVENFYHPYSAVFSDDVKRLSLKKVEGNKYLYLFLKNAILKQQSKYQYAYKFNEKRLKRQKIMLPVTDDGQPDYAFMEQYMVNFEYNKRKQYLDFYALNENP